MVQPSSILQIQDITVYEWLVMFRWQCPFILGIDCLLEIRQAFLIFCAVRKRQNEDGLIEADMGWTDVPSACIKSSEE